MVWFLPGFLCLILRDFERENKNMAKWVKLAIAAAVAVPMLMTTAYAADDYSVVAVQPDNQRTESDNAG